MSPARIKMLETKKNNPQQLKCSFEHKIVLLILDLKMSRMDGIEFFE